VDENKVRVLVADDNEDAANSLAMLLDISGYDVRVALDGQSAVRLAEQWTPDAAILDINMPGLDGYEVAKVLRHTVSREIVLVALSGELSIRQRDLATSVLFDVYCAKGADFVEVQKHLDTLLRAHQIPRVHPR
jgi:DNA-binding response OmpR family regulator